MDRGQTMDAVVTPARDSCVWPSNEDFQEPKKTLKWREVPLGTYKILEVHDHGQGKFGPCVVLNLESRDGATFFVWATPSIVYALKKRKKTEFILNLGSKISEETGGFFYDFKLH